MNKYNLKYLISLNSKRYNFNKLNMDFMDEFKKDNMLKKILVKRNVHLLKYNNKYIGFIWVKKENSKETYNINCMEICKEFFSDINAYNLLLKSFKSAKAFVYKCEKNLYNYSILKKLNFEEIEGNFELEINLEKYFNLRYFQNVKIEPLVKSKEEGIRCYIQNEVFHKDGRIPISIDDIYYDETQNYYIDDGSLFIKLNNEAIGYGQLIFKDDRPFVVNFGLLSEHRGKGYGKYFLQYILNYIKLIGYKKAYINVDINNYVAINLYKSIGFIESKECCLWKKTIMERND
ncbi:GNAT family N-acetyltransferase [Clostridium guangxiense]|uniref:GNAT family N-acetyltransferase n=1 Tax=Clostridium guangxiense TaxID=1662055 RepID=UPI001E3C51C6|nr:GNAT family N-acetyltransferase [Clostridium guangxiense]